VGQRGSRREFGVRWWRVGCATKYQCTHCLNLHLHWCWRQAAFLPPYCCALATHSLPLCRRTQKCDYHTSPRWKSSHSCNVPAYTCCACQYQRS
jgi:hypothetical protein